MKEIYFAYLLPLVTLGGSKLSKARFVISVYKSMSTGTLAKESLLRLLFSPEILLVIVNNQQYKKVVLLSYK